MESGSTSLPMRQRFARSTRRLACSTFSGVAGIETELREFRNAEKQQVRHRRKDGEAYMSHGIRRQKHAGSSGAGPLSFRSSGHEHDAGQQAEQVFEDFQAQNKLSLDRSSVHSKGSDLKASATHSLFCGPACEAPEVWHLLSLIHI